MDKDDKLIVVVTCIGMLMFLLGALVGSVKP